MLFQPLFRTLGFYLWILILPLLFPLGIAIYCDYIDPNNYPQLPCTTAFLTTIALIAIGGLFLWFVGRHSTNLYRKEALLLVICVYFLTPFVGALPFTFSHTLSLSDAYFESTSGLTTTGATIIQAKKYNDAGQEIPIESSFDTGKKIQYLYRGNISPVKDKNGHLLTGIEAISPALLFWRSMMQWLGGGGIIVLFVAILPALGVGGKILYQTEVTGPTKESMAPRIKETALQLWKIYLFLTCLETLLLYFTNAKVSWFDAILISFSTLSTGGFSPTNHSIASYTSAITEWIVIIFMILGSINFSLYFFILKGKFERLKHPELQAFLLILFVMTLFSIFTLTHQTITTLNNQIIESASFLTALRYAAFQVISAQTSTGFATANYDIWPFSTQVILLTVMYFGGMAASTAGGLKVIRLQTFFRIMLNNIESIFRPDTVRNVRIGTIIIDNRGSSSILCFFLVAISLTIIGTFLLVLDGIDPETSLTTIACMINNVGLGFRAGNPNHSFSFLTDFGITISCFWMIAGRLEFFALLIAFVPAFWRKS